MTRLFAIYKVMMIYVRIIVGFEAKVILLYVSLFVLQFDAQYIFPTLFINIQTCYL